MTNQVDSRVDKLSTTASPYADLILHATRLSLLQLHRSRKRHMIRPSNTPALAPKLLQPLREILDFRQQSSSIRATLDMLAGTVSSSGISANVATRASFADLSAGVVNNLLSDQAWRSHIGSTFNLSIPGWWVPVSMQNQKADAAVEEQRSHFPYRLRWL